MLIWSHLDIFCAWCRRCPTFFGSVEIVNQQISKNLLQIRNLRILLYREPCRRIFLACFIMSKNRVKRHSATYPGDPPWFRPKSWLEADVREECFAPFLQKSWFLIIHKNYRYLSMIMQKHHWSSHAILIHHLPCSQSILADLCFHHFLA